jgi:hypothetical protein
MNTSSNLFASSRRGRPLGLLVAGSILFAVTVGGSGALFGAYTGPVAQAAVATVHSAV